MNKTEKYLAIIVLVMLIVTNIALVSVSKKLDTVSKPTVASFGNVMTGYATIASSTVTTSSTLILATSTSDQYRSITNDGATDMYISIGVPAQLGKGQRLNANGGNAEYSGDTLFTGAIYGISSASVNVTTITK